MDRPRSCRARRWAALLLAFCAIGAVRPCAAQTVTATSGSPAAIARIRQDFAAIQREASTYRRTTHEVVNFSLEGGELTGFFRGGELRKLNARLYGETWRGTEDYYFAHGQPVFVHVVYEVYREPFGGGGGMRGAVEHRYYFDGGRLIRHVRTQRPPREDLSNSDPEAPECTAPDS